MALRAGRVSADYFHIGGAKALIGCTFSTSEDQPHGSRAAVLSYRLWRTRFRGNPMLVGSTISLYARLCKLIGVLDPTFTMDPPADLWLPLQADASAGDHLGRVRAVARLRTGFTMEQARDIVRRTIVAFTRGFPGAPMLHEETFTAIALRDATAGDVGQALYLLIRTFVASRTVNRGFDEQNVRTMEMPLADPQFEQATHVAELVRGVEESLRNIPGVAAAAAADMRR